MCVCVLWGCRVVVPGKGHIREQVKTPVRGYLWWPGMDREIKDCVKNCTVCHQPVTPLYPWSWPERPWTRVHIDYAGPLEGLLIGDAHSKWLEAHITNTATSSNCCGDHS